MNKVLVKINRRTSNRELSASMLIEQFRTALTDRVLKAYLFGSFGTDRFTPHSDIDLILVMNTAVPFIDRAEQFFDLYNLYHPLDILVYTPEELKLLLDEPQGFWKSVSESMRRIV